MVRMIQGKTLVFLNVIIIFNNVFASFDYLLIGISILF